MLIDKPTKIKIVKEHLNDGITLKELKERYGISNDHIKYMIALYKRHGEESFHDKIQKYSRELKLEAIKRVYNGESQRQVAIDIGLQEATTMRDWCVRQKITHSNK